MEDGLVRDMTGWRHEFHRHPELGFDLPRTSARVAGLLEEFGYEVHRGIGQSGVVAVLRRGDGRRGIGIRADMDALPVTEANSVGHRSQRDGRMHACGHDGHMAMALGAARRLAENGRFSGRAVFIFQPNEEHGQGAGAMIEDGLFERFPVGSVYALHNMPGLPLGHVATRPGPITASEALFAIGIEARGGHAALPHLGVDAITVGAEIVTALQTIVSRKLDPARNGVVSVTGFQTDGARNVLPGQARLSGDCRALTADTNTRIEAAIRQIADGICSAHGARATVTYETVFAPTINDPSAAAAVARAAAGIAAHVDADCPPRLFSEDFAQMTAVVPGAFLLLGNGTGGPHASPLHSSRYDFNDAALATGAALWVALVEQQLAAG